MGKIIAVANEKGGVGKTTATITLGDIFAKLGYRTLIVDNDPQGSATFSILGKKEDISAHVADAYDGKDVQPIQIRKNLYLLGSSKKLGTKLDKGFEVIYDFAGVLDKYRQKYDYILIDCVPSTSYFLTASLLAADYVLIPIIPEPYAVDGLKEVLDTINKFQRPRFNPNLKVIGSFLNCVPGKQTVITKSIIKGLENEYKNLIFNSKVTRGTAIVESPTRQQSIIDYAPGHKLAKEFTEVANELITRIKKNFIADIYKRSEEKKGKK